MANATWIKDMERPESKLPPSARCARYLADGADQAVASLSAQVGNDDSDAASDVWQAAAHKTGHFAQCRLEARPAFAN